MYRQPIAAAGHIDAILKALCGPLTHCELPEDTDDYADEDTAYHLGSLHESAYDRTAAFARAGAPKSHQLNPRLLTK
ncbi:hypothetical protein PG995_002777 [Apiospora arundinis]